MKPPDYDSSPIYTDGVGIGWVGYGMFLEWPSACFRIFDFKEMDDDRMSVLPREKVFGSLRADMLDVDCIRHDAVG